MRFLVVLLAGARAQGPFNGMSKSTVAAETDPLGAMAFVQKHFGATPDSDSCLGNVYAPHLGMGGGMTRNPANGRRNDARSRK